MGTLPTFVLPPFLGQEHHPSLTLGMVWGSVGVSASPSRLSGVWGVRRHTQTHKQMG